MQGKGKSDSDDQEPTPSSSPPAFLSRQKKLLEDNDNYVDCVI
jgi:hypothetical protein